MSRFKRIEQIADEQLLKFLEAAKGEGYSDFWLVQQALFLLDDSRRDMEISDNNLLGLMKMLKSCMQDCVMPYKAYGDELNKRLKDCLTDIYYIEAANGLRVATVGEVEAGVIGLKAKKRFNIPEEDYKKVCLLLWMAAGKTWLLWKIGYSDIKDDTHPYSKIAKTANELVQLFSWIETGGSFDDILDKMKKASKYKKYTYPEYAMDEVTEDLSVNALIAKILAVFIQGCADNDFRRAIALSVKGKENPKILTPGEISFLRSTYDRYQLESKTGQIKLSDAGKERVERIELIKDKCESLKKAAEDKLIDKKAFVFKIIDTLESCNYRYCSSKQEKLLDEAINEVKESQKTVSAKDKPIVVSEFDIDALTSPITDGSVDSIFSD